MSELLVLDAGMNAMRNASDVTLMTIPKLNELNLQFAFVNTTELSMENASLFESNNELIELKRQTEERRRMEEEQRRMEEEQRRQEEERKRQEEEERKKKEEEEEKKRKKEEKKRKEKEEEEKKKKEAEEERKRLEEEERVRSEQLILETRERIKKGIVLNAKEFHDLPLDIKAITVNGCDDYQSEVLDFSRYDELEELRIGTKCFDYVSKVSIAGLEKLKCVEIGESSFQNNSSDCQLVVKNCPLLSSLTIGDRSFKWFKAFVLDRVPALKTLTIGMYCFKEVSFVAKNLKSVEEIRLGDSSFEKSRHTVMERGRGGGTEE